MVRSEQRRLVGVRKAMSILVAVALISGLMVVGASPALARGCIFQDGTTAENETRSDCENADGVSVTNKSLERYLEIQGDIEADTGAVGEGTFPDGFFASLDPCTSLSSTDGDDNKIRTVYVARSLELAFQIAYDIVSNEITGVSGVVMGIILGVAKVPRFVAEWIYDIQDECQEIVERNSIQTILADTGTILGRVDVAVSTRASQSSLDTFSTNVDIKLADISSAIAALEALLIAETDEIDAAIAASRVENLTLYIEDHLDTCRPLASLLLPDSAGGFLEDTVALVTDLADRAEANGLGIGRARTFLDQASARFASGDVAQGYQKLCSAYDHIANGI